MPPPMELISKTVFHEEEPIKTGAPIAFVQVEKLNGGKCKLEEAISKPKTSEEKEKLKESKVFEVDLKPEVAQIRASSQSIH